MERRIRPFWLPLLLLVALLGLLWLTDRVERQAALQPQAQAAGAPVFSPPGGVYPRGVRVSIQPSTAGAPVVLALGGSAPTTTVGVLYEQPLRLDRAAPGVTVLRAREVAGGAPGSLVSASYVVGVENQLPVLSLVADPVDLWDAQRGILANTWQRGVDWERPAHVSFFDGATGFALSAGLRVNGSEEWDAPKQSLRLYFRGEYGEGRLDYALFDDHPHQETQSYNHLLLQAGQREGRWTLLEEALLGEVAAELDGHVTQGRFVLLFLNGESQGIYRLSERVDRFFLADNWGVADVDLIRGGRFEEGDDVQWNALVDWLATHELADPVNAAELESRVDVDDFIDYAIVQLYFDSQAFVDDQFSAARPRVGGGRWFWIYGDGQQRYGLSSGTDAVRVRGGELALLLERLLEAPAYRARFARRMNGLLNTTLAPAAMEARLARLAGELRADVHYEAERWPAAGDWPANVDTMREIVRRRPDVLRAWWAERYGLAGTAVVSLNASAGGSLVVDGLPVPAPVWSGSYFLDSAVEVIAAPRPGYAFAGWEGAAGASTRLTLTVDGPRALTARFAPATEESLRPDDVMIVEYWINDDGTRYASLDNRPLEGDWLELRVVRPQAVDLRGWRITDNDTLGGTDEGSLILPALAELAAVPRGTAILIVATESPSNAAYFPQDDLDGADRRMLFYVGNGNLDVTSDPGFGIGAGDDNLALLAPGPDAEVGVDFVAEGRAVTPYSFGVLVDGVVFEHPFRGLGADDGALFAGAGSNDDGAVGWVVDPPASESGDEAALDVVNRVTPGAANRAAVAGWLLVALAVLAAVVVVVLAIAQGVRNRTGR